MGVENTKEYALLQQAYNELAYRDYIEYLQMVHNERYIRLRHTDYIAKHLQEIADGKQKHIIVELQPRAGKSMLISETFPSYFIGKNPSKKVIATAYSESLARKFGRLNRNKLVEFGAGVFGVTTSRDNSTATNWSLDQANGGMVATGIGGSITGEGADCCTFSTMVDTEVGKMKIGEIHEMKHKPLVLSYNHEKGIVEYKEAQVTRRIKTNEITKISTVSGREISSTKEHNHYDYERGYRAAHLFRPGDKLTVQRNEVQHSLQSVWREKRWKRNILSRLLPLSAEENSYIGVQSMRKTLRVTDVRIRKEIKERLSILLLRLRMQRLSQFLQDISSVRYLRESYKERQNVLFEGMPSRIQKSQKEEKKVHRLSKKLLSNKFKSINLFKYLSKRSAFENEEVQYKGFDEIPRIQTEEKKSFRERRLYLPSLQCPKKDVEEVRRNEIYKFSSPSQRREYIKQLNEKLSDRLSFLSYDAPQIKPEEVESVTTEYVDEFVYDIQVEDNHNFFANGILVHNCLIIDDPIKNNEEAQSQTIRDKIWDEWETTLSTRLHKGASVIVVMTRWHEDDLVGRLLERSPYDWERIRMPAIAEDEDDLLGREVGEALAPELGYDEAWADLKKREVGSRTWASLYQQRPSAAEGNIFRRDWWKFYDHLPRLIDETIISWDLSFKGDEKSDYVVGQVWKRHGADKYLVDQVRGQFSFTETLAAVKQLSSKYPEGRRILIEDKANGPAVISTLKREISGIIAVEPRGSKVARAQAVTPDIEAGNVFLPNGKEFTYDLIEECAAFSNGKHDKNIVVYKSS